MTTEGKLPKRIYTAEDYKRMLINVLDIHYGGAVHHIGDGDGLSKSEAIEISEFWQTYLEDRVREYYEPKPVR